MIKIDGKVYANLELAMPFFKAALQIEISYCNDLTSLEAPAATCLRIENNAALKNWK